MAKKTNNSIIIASDLRTGRSVFFGADGWSDFAVDAEVLNPDVAEERLAAVSSSEKSNLVIDPYLVAVGADRVALDIREQIRLSGPTIFEQNHPAAAA